jgi:hypothetical protein
MKTSNGEFVKSSDKSVSNDEKSNGFGMENPTLNAVGFQGDGSQSEMRVNRLARESVRFNDLQSKAFGSSEITSGGIVLDVF